MCSFARRSGAAGVAATGGGTGGCGAAKEMTVFGAGAAAGVICEVKGGGSAARRTASMRAWSGVRDVGEGTGRR